MLEQFSSAITNVFSKFSSVGFDFASLEKDLRNTLIDADTPLEIATQLSKMVAEEIKKKSSSMKNSSDLPLLGAFTLKEKLKNILTPKNGESNLLPSSGGIVFFIGPPGGGKTTTIAKFALEITQQSKKLKDSILVCSIDKTRPAAQEQLETLCNKKAISFLKWSSGPIVEFSQKLKNEQKRIQAETKSSIILVDTPGLLSTNITELRNAISELEFSGPRKTILVLDSMMGQRGLELVKNLGQEISFDGAILSKIDANSKAGIAISFAWSTGKPIIFYCDGEGLEDIDSFDPERFSSRLVGLGDETQIKKKIEASLGQSNTKKDSDLMRKKILSGNLTLDDYASQIKNLQKMGSLTKVLSYLPMFGSKIDNKLLEKEQEQMFADLSIINSMTLKERNNVGLLDQNRKIRIAKGSGLDIIRVDELINRFTRMRDSVKMLARTHL